MKLLAHSQGKVEHKFNYADAIFLIFNNTENFSEKVRERRNLKLLVRRQPQHDLRERNMFLDQKKNFFFYSANIECSSWIIQMFFSSAHCQENERDLSRIFQLRDCFWKHEKHFVSSSMLKTYEKVFIKSMIAKLLAWVSWISIKIISTIKFHWNLHLIFCCLFRSRNV